MTHPMTSLKPDIRPHKYRPPGALSPSPTHQHHHDIAKAVPAVDLHCDGEGFPTPSQATALQFTARRGINASNQENRCFVCWKPTRIAEPQACRFEHPGRGWELCS